MAKVLTLVAVLLAGMLSSCHSATSMRDQEHRSFMERLDYGYYEGREYLMHPDYREYRNSCYESCDKETRTQEIPRSILYKPDALIREIYSRGSVYARLEALVAPDGKVVMSRIAESTGFYSQQHLKELALLPLLMKLSEDPEEECLVCFEYIIQTDQNMVSKKGGR